MACMADLVVVVRWAVQGGCQGGQLSDNRYLLRQGHAWSVVVEVPRPLQAKLGRRLKRTLGTRDVLLARTRRWPVVAELKKLIEEAQTGATRMPDALAFRTELEQARQAEAEQPVRSDDDPNAALTSPTGLVQDAIVEKAEQIEREQGEQAAQVFAAVALGRATPVTLYADDWLAGGTLSGRPLSRKAAHERRSSIQKLTDWLASEKLPGTVEAITRRIAGRFVGEHLASSGAAPVSWARHVRNLSAYWRWLDRRGIVHVGVGDTELPDVWGKLVPRVGSPTVNSLEAERPFTDAEMVKLLSGNPPAPLREFMIVAALSGMRRDEIAKLTVGDCSGGVFIIKAGKTASVARRVPVHSTLVPIVERRMAGKQGGDWLFHEIGSGPDRAGPIGTAFTRYRRRLGIQEGTGRRSKVNFHSFRRFFITSAVNAGQPGHMVSLVVGHAEGRKGMTLGRYWAGADDEALRAVVEAVRLPAPQ